jgi:very-short-patch-repair endonuclease
LVLPDFIHIPSKKIIEFDGVYYHRNTPENKTRELKRDEDLRRNGYSVFHVNEKEYKLFPDETISKCKKFLNETGNDRAS